MATPPEDAAKSSPKMTSAFWFDEEIAEDALTIRMRLKSITFDQASQFQRVQIIETVPFGKTLVLDGKTQSALGDEYIYHESLVHPALTWHGAPRRVYVGGGGELATARECLRHASVEEVVMVDLDGTVVDVCREHLPEWNAGATDDKRLTLKIGDARAYLLDAASGSFDVIVLDISDPIEAGPAVHLYTREFYELVREKLTPGGVVVTQAGPGGVFNFNECFTAIHNTLRQAFDVVHAYTTSIPSFGSEWGFCVARCHSDNGESSNDGGNDDAARPTRGNDSDACNKRPRASTVGIRDASYVAALDSDLASRLTSELRHYDAETHLRMFNLPKVVRNGIKAETRVITEANPVFMY